MIRILFLEDEPTIQDVTAEYMKMKNYDVTCVKDAKEALYKMKNDKYDLAVLDINVPKGSGLDVLEYIKSSNSSTATIMLTALGDEETQIRAFNMNADDYVVKPFSPILLLKRIEAVLRRTINQNSEVLKKDGLFIKDDSYEVYYNNVSLKLTLSEFLLLQTLMKEPQRAFTREQLILRIFDDEYCGNDRIIDAHVKNIRKKLPKNYIKTVNGIGYQFNKEA